MSPRRDSVGNGDTCPLFPQHGVMLVLGGSTPVQQVCPHQEHDGGPGKGSAPQSRSVWPLHGFEDTVATYMARLDRAIREAGLPDLSDLSL